MTLIKAKVHSTLEARFMPYALDPARPFLGPVVLATPQATRARVITHPAMNRLHLLLATIFLSAAFGAAQPSTGASTVDLRYSPPEWQTSICLPDDAHKTLVDRSGELLYYYGKGGREFATRLKVEAVPDAIWEKQELVSARVPIVQTRRTAPDLEILEEAFAVTSVSSPGIDSAQKARNDLILVQVTNRGTAPRTLHPRLVVDTVLPFQFEPDGPQLLLNGHEIVTASLKMLKQAGLSDSKRTIELEPVTVGGGQRATFYLLYAAGGTIVLQPRTMEEAIAARDQAVRYWEAAPLPFGRVEVPDRAIQALVDSSIRNIWQAREIKNGTPVFQVGPTCYRNLWIVDGAFLLESAAMLGAGQEARHGIAYTLTQQKPSGAFEVLSPQYYKENGIVLWTCVRHAMLTQDKAWLASLWPKLEATAAYIQVLRQRSCEDATPLNDGINPPGEIDGGLSGHGTGFKRSEFSNAHWNLLGLHAFIQAAHWLGKDDSAARWQKEYDDFYATVRRASARDLCHDDHGNAYVPIFMANEGHELPQRAQWTFCHAVYPGQIFAQDDPLVASTMAMLQATEREGLVYGTGWDATGIWNYFASFYGHAWLWQGNGPKAAQILYAYANHAAPTWLWREEQSLTGQPFRKVGDMPHNWASAEFIRLTIHLLALDRGDELHLLEGWPREWARPGMLTRLQGVATPFGALFMNVRVGSDGERATVEVKPLASNCKAVVVHLPDGSTQRLPPQEGGTLTFAVTAKP